MDEQKKDVWTFGVAHLPPSLFFEMKYLRDRIRDLEDQLVKVNEDLALARAERDRLKVM